MDIDNIEKRCIKIRGKEWCLQKLAEECNELGASILQYLTKESTEINILKESADVEIAINIIKKIYKNNLIEYKEKKYLRIDKKCIEIENANT